MRVCKSALEKEKVNIMQIYSLRVGHIKGRGGLLEKTVRGKASSGEPREARLSRNMLSQRADSKAQAGRKPGWRLRETNLVTPKNGGESTGVNRQRGRQPGVGGRRVGWAGWGAARVRLAHSLSSNSLGIWAMEFSFHMVPAVLSQNGVAP